MKKRSKIKKQKTASPIRTKTVRARKYESHYLAIILIVFLLLEGTLISSTNGQDWKKGLDVLDVSSAVSQTSQDLATVFTPVTDTIANVNHFYALATDQMTQILDLSDVNPISDISLVTDGVYQFYSQAATQMASMLDISGMIPNLGYVAGASVLVR